MFRTRNQYNIFISHSWHYHEHYDKIKDWVAESNINCRDYSISIEKRLPSMPDYQLRIAISEQIAHAAIVIIPAGMYATYSSWIEYEISEAIRMGKKIIGIIPWGQERVPRIITENATQMVHWNQTSVINGIKRLL